MDGYDSDNTPMNEAITELLARDFFTHIASEIAPGKFSQIPPKFAYKDECDAFELALSELV